MEASAVIKEARTAAGLTQAELAERARVKQPVIARLERPGANPRLQTLRKVVAAAGHSLTFELARDAEIDETLIVASLRETPSQRLRAMDSLLGFAREFGRSPAGAAAS
jgi:transcriptional regulator with XRE-family HTH domain